MIIKLSKKEMQAVTDLRRKFDLPSIPSSIGKVIMHEATEDKEETYEIKIQKKYMEPVLGIIAKYAGIFVPMVKSGVALLKSMSGDIDEVEKSMYSYDKAPEPCDDAKEKQEEIKTE